jgi:branched-subunit amino acid ABC-type transport system permease component
MTGFLVLNGASFAALLFIVASGFTLIFGLMRTVNLVHDALYLLGGYIGYAIAASSYAVMHRTPLHRDALGWCRSVVASFPRSA